MATVRQIAKHSGFSPATVSRVINNYEHVSHDVREQVIRSARELGGFRDSRNIAILISANVTFWSYSGCMLAALLDKLKKRNYHELIVTENSTHLLHEHLLDGAISMIMHSGIERLWPKRQSIPLICINSRPRHISGIYSVFCNDRQGITMALDHLWRLGHVRIGYLENSAEKDQRNLNLMRRQEAYHQWMDAHHLSPVVMRQAEELVGTIGSERLTAILSIGEMHGLRTWSILRNAGYRIPEDLSLVCFSNPSLAFGNMPDLTSIEQDYSKMASRVIDQLERLIAGKRIEDLEIDYRFIPGGSIAPPPMDPAGVR